MVTKIFLTGATGYIGGSIIQRLLSHPNAKSFEITALVRNPDKAKLLESFGVKPVIGSHSDTDKLEALAAQSNVVFTVADCDDVAAAKAILAGHKKRHAETGEVPILIHTSGTGVISDNAAGKFASDVIYSDLDIPLIESLPPSAPHRPVDILVSGAGKEGYVRTHIILPSTIYGIAKGPLYDKGVSNPHSVQVPALIKASWDRGQGGMVGEGKNIWPCVHIDEIVDLYIVLYDAATANPNTPSGREGFYFGESDHYLMYDVVKTVAKVLVELGRGKSEEPTTFTDEEMQKYFGGSAYLGSNSRCKAERSRAIGWKTTKSVKDMLASIKPETEGLIANGRISNAVISSRDRY